MSARKATPKQPVKPTLNAGDYKKMIKEDAEDLAFYVKAYIKNRGYKEHIKDLIKAKEAEIKSYIDEMVAIAIKPEEPKEDEKVKKEAKKEIKKEVKKEVKKEDNDNDNYDYDSIN